MVKAMTPLPPNLHIGGDMLALDRGLRGLIATQAREIETFFPDRTAELRVNIVEEFDQARGHQVRCEVVAALADRRQVIVREFRKQAREAVTEAFAATKVQLRRLRRRAILPVGPTTPTLSSAGI
jgi:ribosome-associated translation inhibitor RaiA